MNTHKSQSHIWQSSPPTTVDNLCVLICSFYFFFFKDERYWSRRCKNNEAAKRSRDARRLKENQISVRASFLERENAALRQEVADMRKELGRCRNILNKYESHHMDQ